MADLRVSVPDLTGRRVLVTGGRGFIGRRIVKYLADAGATVTVVLRSGHEAKDLRDLGAQVEIGQLVPGRSLDKLLSEKDILVHAAYDVRAGYDENMASFTALYDSALAVGLPRFVHLSSVVVYDNWPNGKLNEDSPISTPGGGDYRQAKISMENILMQGDLDAKILQPTIVYGPGSAMWTKAPIAQLAAGGIVLPEPSGRCAAVYVDDVAQAALLAGATGTGGSERFLINGPDQMSWKEFYEGYQRIVGKGEILSVPLSELESRLGPETEEGESSGPSAAARVSASLRRVIGTRRFDKIMDGLRARRSGGGPVYPDRFMLKLLSGNPEISIERARGRLGYEPAFDFNAGLAEI